MTPDQQRIMGIIARHHGYDNAITRQALVHCTSFDDRHIRACIEVLRKEYRKPILSNPETGGYFLATCEEDERRSLAPRVAKVASEFATIRALSASVAHALATKLFEDAPRPVATATRCLHPICNGSVPEGRQTYCSDSCQDSVLTTAAAAGYEITEEMRLP